MTLKIFFQVLLSFLILGQEHLYAAVEVKKEKFANGNTANESYYQGNLLVEQRFYSTDGNFTSWQRYQYPEPGHVIKASISVEKESFGQTQWQEEWTGLNEKNDTTENSVRLRRWVYTDEVPHKFEYIENYETKKPFRILKKDYLNDKNQFLSSIFFSYKGDEEKPYAFVEKNAEGKIISQFSMYEPYDLVKTLRAQGRSEKEIEILKRQRENPNKFLIAIIDSGFDYNHEALVTKWWNNPNDPMDGIDNDKNGWVDDNFGWEQVRNIGLPTESSTGFQKDNRPLSHGTHVAHIAIRGLDNAALIGFAGDYTQAAYVNRISAFLKQHQVKVVNMSIGLPSDNKDLLGLRDAIKAYSRMIDNNPDTLFVVASGNAEQDLDDYKNRQYPASFTQPNVLKVGALDASDYSEVTPQNAKMAYFSNYGKTSVDILAPGVKVSAASLGGGLIAHSGTSMATPYMVNLVARLWSELPHLKASEVRELFIKTAQVLPTPAPILSKGYADLNAALLQGKIDHLLGNYAKKGGPNCWNSATYLANISEAVHHTLGSEFAFVIDSPLCKQISKEEMKKGDIVALRRFNKSGKLLPAAMFSEVHGYTYLGDGKGFTKNGVTETAPYQIQTTAEIFNFYKSSESKNCKMNGIDREHCNLKEVAYRCTDFETYMSKKGGLNVFERDVLFKISNLEKNMQAKLLYGQIISLDFDKVIKAVQEDIENLKTAGSSELVTDYFEARLESLNTQF